MEAVAGKVKRVGKKMAKKKSREKGRRGRDRDVADLQAPYCRLKWLYQMRMRDRNRSGVFSATLAFLC